jgi:hypothetical protein
MLTLFMGTTLLDGVSRDRSPVLSLENFSVAADGTMCPGVDSASKNKYQDTPGDKDGRCVRVTTLPPSLCRKSRKSRALTYRNHLGHLGPSRDTFTFTSFVVCITSCDLFPSLGVCYLMFRFVSLLFLKFPFLTSYQALSQ